MRRCAKFLVLVFIAALAVMGKASAAEVTAVPTTLGLPAGPDETSTQSLFLRPARPGSLKIDSVNVEYVSGPDDVRLATGTVEVANFAPGTAGTIITLQLKLKRPSFARPGLYKIGLRVTGQRADAAPLAASTPVDDVLELSLSRAAAQLTVGLPNNARILVDRGFPWYAGDQQVSFSVSQDSGPDIDALNLKAGAIVKASDGLVVPGTVAMDPSQLKLRTGLTESGKLTFQNLERAGDFKTDLTFTAPGLAKSVVVPVTIGVKDSWFLPLLVIIAGVLTGATVHYLLRVWRPRQLVSYRLAQAQIRLESLAPAIGTDTTRRDYDQLRVRLRTLFDGVEIDQTTDAQIQLFETDVTTLQKQLLASDTAANDTLRKLQQEVDKARRDLVPHGGAAEHRLGQFQDELDSCKQVQIAGRSEEAQERAISLQEALPRLRVNLALDAVNEMGAEIAKLNDPAERTELENKAHQADTDIRRGNGDIIQILTDLRSAINLAQGRASDSTAFAAPETKVRYSLQAFPEPESRRVGTTIRFEIDPAPAKIKAVRWTLDGNYLTMTKEATMRRSQPVLGVFMYSAEIEFTDTSLADADPLRVTVLPSEAIGLVRSLLNGIQRVDFGLLAISIVVASITGLLDRYVDKSFGTLTDYCWAFLWGFGIDSVVKGFAATFTRLKG